MPRRSPRPLGRLVPALLALLGGLAPWRPAPARAAPSEGPAVEVVDLAGAVASGRLEALGPGGVRVATPSGPRTVAAEDVREVRWIGAGDPAPPRAPHLRLTLVGGGRLLGTLRGPAPDGIEVENPAAGRLAVPFEAVRSVESLPGNASPCEDAAARRRAAPDADRIHVRSGDAYAGILAEATTEGLVIETERGARRTVAWADLLVLHLQSDPTRPATAGRADLAAEVETTDGSTFVTEAFPVGDGSALSFRLAAVPGADLRVAAAAVVRLRAINPRFAYASELAWRGEWSPYYEDAPGEPSLRARWFAPRADRRPSGCPLRVGGRTAARGFGVHSRTVLTVPLGKAWRTFETAVGIDDETLVEEGTPRGDVDARIRGDGVVLWEAKGIRGGEPARRVGPLDVSRVDELVLEVDFGEGMEVQDHADWLDPLLLRK